MGRRRFCPLFFALVLVMPSLSAHPGQLVRKLSAPGTCPTGTAFDGKHVWVADYKADRLFALDPNDGKVVRSIPSPGFWPMGLAWDGKHLWNVDALQKKVFQVDPADGTILKTIRSPASRPSGLAWDGDTLWVADRKRNKLMRLDLSDGTALKTLQGPDGATQGLTFDGTYLWCANREGDELYMMEPEHGQVILVCPAPGPYASGLAWDGKHLWNVDYQTDKLYKLVRRDDALYTLNNPRTALTTLTHQVKAFGQGALRSLNVYIALPRDSARQKILATDFSTADYKLVDDQWHQPVAAFSYDAVKGGTQVETVMTVKATLHDITWHIFPDRCGKLSNIPDAIRKPYTQDGSKYQINHPYMQKTMKQVVGNEKNPYWIARKIFDFVRGRLTYKMEGGWNTAPFVLQRGTGSCSEYSFCFIGLARAAGLPARYVGAIVVRGDDASIDDSFHRWPEVYLPNYGWVPIDPQAGDKPDPRDVAMSIGHRANRYLITTQGGGDSQYLGWYYNQHETYTADPQVSVTIETIGEWEPAEK